MIPTGYSQSEDDGYERVILTCPREGCGATNVSIIDDMCRCNYCGYESNIESFVPKTLDEESYYGY